MIGHVRGMLSTYGSDVITPIVLQPNMVYANLWVLHHSYSFHSITTVGTATAGDIVVTPAPTPTTSVSKIVVVQSQPATSTPDALTPLWWTTPGQTTMDSTTHTMTSTRKHRTTLLECEAGKLHLKKGVML